MFIDHFIANELLSVLVENCENQSAFDDWLICYQRLVELCMTLDRRRDVSFVND